MQAASLFNAELDGIHTHIYNLFIKTDECKKED